VIPWWFALVLGALGAVVALAIAGALVVVAGLAARDRIRGKR
jgi:Na+/proline symporter